MTDTESPDERPPDETPFGQPDLMTGYPLSKDEQERVDRLVENAAQEEGERKQ